MTPALVAMMVDCCSSVVVIDAIQNAVGALGIAAQDLDRAAVGKVAVAGWNRKAIDLLPFVTL